MNVLANTGDVDRIVNSLPRVVNCHNLGRKTSVKRVNLGDISSQEHRRKVGADMLKTIYAALKL